MITEYAKMYRCSRRRRNSGTSFLCAWAKVLDFEDLPAAVKDLTADLLGCSPENIEINKIENTTPTSDKYRCDETSKNTVAVPKEEEKRTPTYSKEWSF